MEEWDLFTFAEQQSKGRAEQETSESEAAAASDTAYGREYIAEPENPAEAVTAGAENTDTATVSAKAEVQANSVLRPKDYQQLAFGFLCSLDPDGAAEHVAIRACKPLVAAAGFWRPESGRRLDAVRSAAVVMYLDRSMCFADCAGQDELLAELAELHIRQSELEADIREKEPELAASDDLFNEFRTWDYASSSDRRYHKLCRRIDKIMRDLNAGSRLERIRRAGVADLCYLAVPEGLIDPSFIPADWGIVELGPGRFFRVVRDPVPQTNVTPAGRSQLALSIAQAAAAATRFASGVERLKSGKIVYHAPPRRRRAVLD